MYQIPGERWVEALQLFRGTWCFSHRRDAISTLDKSPNDDFMGFFSIGFNHWNMGISMGNVCFSMLFFSIGTWEYPAIGTVFFFFIGTWEYRNGWLVVTGSMEIYDFPMILGME